jgi:hypothetical protein
MIRDSPSCVASDKRSFGSVVDTVDIAGENVSHNAGGRVVAVRAPVATAAAGKGALMRMTLYEVDSTAVRQRQVAVEHDLGRDSPMPPPLAAHEAQRTIVLCRVVRNDRKMTYIHI